MSDKDNEIINSYKQGETPKQVKQNVSNQNGRVTVKDGTVTLNEGVVPTLYRKEDEKKKKWCFKL